MIECNKVSGTGTVTNEAGGKVTFGTYETEFTKCEMKDPPACNGKPVTILKMVTEVTGPVNLKFSTSTVEDSTKAKVPLKGFLYATPRIPTIGAPESGATAIFTGASTAASLTFGGTVATLDGSLTFRKENGDPLILTTTP